MLSNTLEEKKNKLGKHMYSLNVLSLNTVIVSAKWSKSNFPTKLKNVRLNLNRSNMDLLSVSEAFGSVIQKKKAFGSPYFFFQHDLLNMHSRNVNYLITHHSKNFSPLAATSSFSSLISGFHKMSSSCSI
jgi:hypothetical protein